MPKALLPLGSTLTLGVPREGKTLEVGANRTAEKLTRADSGQLDARLAGVRFSELGESQRHRGIYGWSERAPALRLLKSASLG